MRRLTLCVAAAIVAGVVVPASAQDDARANLEAIYGIYHIGEFCQQQGLSFTGATLSTLKEMALGFEQQLGDEAVEAQLWEETGKTAGMLVGLMAMDGELATVQCGQLAASVHAMAAKSEKPF